MIVELGLALLLVAANGFFVAAEFSITRVRPTQVAELEALGRRGVGSLRHAVDHIDSYLAACQLGITISSIGLGFVGKPAFEELLAPIVVPLGGAIPGVTAYALSFATAFGLVTVLHVVLGELAPKSLAIARPSTTALAIAGAMRGFYLCTKPLVDVFNWMGNLLLLPFGIPTARESGHAPHSEDELRMLLRQSAQGGVIEHEEQALAENVFELSDRSARQVMVPRHEIAYLTSDQSLNDAAKLMHDKGHTRMPLCEPAGELDRPIGIINAIDVLGAINRDSHDDTLQTLVRPVAIAPEAAPITRVLADMRRARQPMSLIADEYGTITGLMTIEDIIEEVFGEMYDEFDTEIDATDSESVQREPDGSLLVPGTFPPQRLSEFGITIPTGDYATTAGFALKHFEHIPTVGERFNHGSWHIEVTQVNGHAIQQLRIHPQKH